MFRSVLLLLAAAAGAAAAGRAGQPLSGSPLTRFIGTAAQSRNQTKVAKALVRMAREQGKAVRPADVTRLAASLAATSRGRWLEKLRMMERQGLIGGAADATAGADRLRADLQKIWRNFAGLYNDPAKTPRELRNTVIITIANWGYRDVYHNWDCLAQRFGLKYIVMSMDEKMHGYLGNRSVLLPGAKGGELKTDSEPFNLMGCNKLAGVIALMEEGADVIIVDTDCVFKRDPLPFFQEAARYDFLFQPNHHGCSEKNQMPPGSCMLINSGLYYVSSKKPSVRALWASAHESCLRNSRAKPQSATEGGSDQRALQRALHDSLGLPTHWTRGVWTTKGYNHRSMPKGWRPALSGLPKSSPFKAARWCGQEGAGVAGGMHTFEYCVLDPWLYPSGKHTKTQRLVALHVNHKAGGKKVKIMLMKRFGVWVWDADRSKCLAPA